MQYTALVYASPTFNTPSKYLVSYFCGDRLGQDLRILFSLRPLIQYQDKRITEDTQYLSYTFE